MAWQNTTRTANIIQSQPAVAVFKAPLRTLRQNHTSSTHTQAEEATAAAAAATAVMGVVTEQQNKNSYYGYFEMKDGFVDKFRQFIITENEWKKKRDILAEKYGVQHQASIVMPKKGPLVTDKYLEFKKELGQYPIRPDFGCMCQDGMCGWDCVEDDVRGLWWLEDKIKLELGYITQDVFDKKYR